MEFRLVFLLYYRFLRGHKRKTKKWLWTFFSHRCTRLNFVEVSKNMVRVATARNVNLRIRQKSSE